MRRDCLLLLIHKSYWLAKPFILPLMYWIPPVSPCIPLWLPHHVLDLLRVVFCSSTMQTHWNGNQSKSCFCFVQRQASVWGFLSHFALVKWWDTWTAGTVPTGAWTRALQKSEIHHFIAWRPWSVSKCGNFSTVIDGKIAWPSVLCWAKSGGNLGLLVIYLLDNLFLFEQSGLFYLIR